MLNYIYDGSFEGLLTCVYESFYSNQKPDNILPGPAYQESLLDNNMVINADLLKAKRLMGVVSEKISPDALENIFYAFLSEINGAGTLIYKYLELGFKMGSKVNLYMSNEHVFQIHDLCRKVIGERHRMLGLIRFKNLKGGIFYAPIEPNNNIIYLLARHFERRMPCQDWIIHDLKRTIAVLYHDKKWSIQEFSLDTAPILEKDEHAYQQLWKEYFKSITISSRVNPQLQKRNMPVRYWKYLVEKLPD